MIIRMVGDVECGFATRAFIVRSSINVADLLVVPDHIARFERFSARKHEHRRRIVNVAEIEHMSEHIFPPAKEIFT